MSDPDFEEQLKLEELEKHREELGERTYRDKDGTLFEWDNDRKAYFPKIDEDFIAQYQMNYGTATCSSTTSTTNATSTTATENTTTAGTTQNTSTDQGTIPDPSDPNYAQWYYYYYGHQGYGTGENSTAENRDNADNSNYDYYSYYGYDYSSYNTENQTSATGDNSEKTDDGKDGETSKDEKNEVDHDPHQVHVALKRKAKPPATWFEVEEDKNTNVYVTGLPTDITDKEFEELMGKCGLVMYDPVTKKPKVKLYRDQNGQLKGDGLCGYIKVESVQLALEILDGSNFKGNTISVQKAKFELKGKFDPKRRKKLTNNQKRKLKERQEKLFDWRPDKPFGTRAKHEKTVIIKGMFDPKEFEAEPTLINEFRNDLRVEAAKIGEVKKVIIYDHHPEGVASITYKEPEEADQCITVFNGRWFAKRKLTAETWDGKTKYEIQETAEEREARLKKWQNYLEGKNENTDNSKSGPLSETEGAVSGALEKKEGNESSGETDMDESNKTDDDASAATSASHENI